MLGLEVNVPTDLLYNAPRREDPVGIEHVFVDLERTLQTAYETARINNIYLPRDTWTSTVI